MLITESYRELNRQLHETGKYGISGFKWAGMAKEFADSLGAKTVLDYGAGQGTFGMEFRRIAPELTLWEYDPAIEGKETKPLRADLVVCGDVLEHIEPDCLYAVLDDLANISRLGILFVIGTVPAKKTLADGRNAHLIVESPNWWLNKLLARWRFVRASDFGKEFVVAMKR